VPREAKPNWRCLGNTRQHYAAVSLQVRTQWMLWRNGKLSLKFNLESRMFFVISTASNCVTRQEKRKERNMCSRKLHYDPSIYMFQNFSTEMRNAEMKCCVNEDGRLLFFLPISSYRKACHFHVPIPTFSRPGQADGQPSLSHFNLTSCRCLYFSLLWTQKLWQREKKGFAINLEVIFTLCRNGN